MQKTKWQQFLEAEKGCTEYNPTQSFVLQVYWVVRSATAAAEMINKGFQPCARATERDTPTTLAYMFRLSRDQRLADKLKNEVTTLGEHPHYKPAFKSLQMGIPLPSVEMKLKVGGIDLTPLRLDPNEPLSSHATELDYDPVVLECTELYLDDRSFYEHTASREWMAASPEILKASRSLKPLTYCVGSPSQTVWSNVIEPTLKAVRIDRDDRQQVKDLQPGVYFVPFGRDSDSQTSTVSTSGATLFLELDLVISNEKLQICRDALRSIQSDLEAPYLIVLPIGLCTDEENKERSSELCALHESNTEVRVMLAFVCSEDREIRTSLRDFLQEVCTDYSGRVISFNDLQGRRDDTEQEGGSEDQCTSARMFMELAGLRDSKISIEDAASLSREKKLAGYALHPLFRQLSSNDQLTYKV